MSHIPFPPPRDPSAPSAPSARHYSHRSGARSAEVAFHESERLWVVSIKSAAQERVHGFYPSLASAQLILNALGFMPC